MAGPGCEAGVNEVSGTEELLSNWADTAAWPSHRGVFLQLFLFLHSLCLSQEWNQSQWEPEERFLWEIRWEIALPAGVPQNYWVPRGDNHATSLHGGTASPYFASSLLVHKVKGPSDGIFSTAPLYFNYLFAAPILYLVWSTQDKNFRICPKDWVTGLPLVDWI